MTTDAHTQSRGIGPDSDSVHLEVWMDIACPWCFIGRRNLAVAIADLDPGQRPNVTWRAFQLDPNIPEEGVDNDTYFEQKFGDRLPQIREGQERLQLLGEDLSIGFRFDRQRVRPNTLRAHRIVAAAEEFALDTVIIDALQVAYFERGVDIGDAALLEEVIAAAIDDPERAAQLVAAADSEPAIAERVASDIAAAGELGITGVPCFVADRAMAVPGAVPPDGLAQFLAEAAARREDV